VGALALIVVVTLTALFMSGAIAGRSRSIIVVPERPSRHPAVPNG